MLVLTVITSYNDSVFLDQAIQTCLSQTHQSDILIVIDGYSDTRLKSLESTYSNQKNVIFHKLWRNVGKSACCNIALTLYAGNYEYVCFLDSDDKWTSEKLECQISFLEKERSFAACGTSYIVEDEVGNELGSVMMPTSEIEIMSKSLCAPAMLWSSIMIRSSVARRLLLREEFRAAMDYDFCLRLLKDNMITNSTDRLTTYTIRRGSITNSPNRTKQLRNHIYSLAYNLVGELSAAECVLKETLALTYSLVLKISADNSLTRLRCACNDVSQQTIQSIKSSRLGEYLLEALESQSLMRKWID